MRGGGEGGEFLTHFVRSIQGAIDLGWNSPIIVSEFKTN